jgi:hypothetical protein
MARWWSWFLVVVLFGVYFAAVADALRRRAEAGKGMPEFSVYSEEANGLAESARLLRKLGWEPVALTRPPSNPRQRGLLLVTQPRADVALELQTELPVADVLNLLQWVEAGNTLILSSSRSTSLHRKLGVDVSEAHDDDLHTADLASDSPYLDGVKRVVLEGRHTLSGAGLPLWYVGTEPGALLQRHGAGRVLVIADPSLFTLRGLLRGDNAVFLVNLTALHARGGRIYYDEYHHGIRSGGGFFGYLRHHGVQSAVLPLLLVVGVVLWAGAVRLGLATPSPRAARADAVDYASAVARVYHQAGAARLAARALVRSFLADLTRHLRLRRGAVPAEILAAWNERHPGKSAERLQELLRGLPALRKGEVRGRKLLAWCRAFDSFRNEVMHASRRT